VDPVIQRLWEVQASNPGEASVEKLLFGFVIFEIPVLEEVPVHLCGDFLHERVTQRFEARPGRS